MWSIAKRGLFSLMACLLVTACTVSEDEASLRVVELVDSLPSTDAYLDDVKYTSGAGFESIGTYVITPVGEQSLSLRSSDGTGNLLSTTIEPVLDGRYTVIIAGTASAPTSFFILENPEGPASNLSRLTVLNTITAGPDYDVFITGDNADINSISPTVATTSSGQFSDAFDFDTGTYRVRITTGPSRELVYDSGVPANVAFNPGAINNLIIYASSGASLVKAAMLTGATGDAVATTRSTLASIRLVNAATTAEGLNLRESASAAIFAGLTTGNASNYQRITAAAAIDFELYSNAASYGIFPLQLNPGEDHTILASGTDPNISLSVITDTNTAPRNGLANLRTVNAVSGAGDANVFVNARADFADVGENQASSNYLEYTPGTGFNFVADFASSGTQTFDLGTNFELETDRVYTLLISGPASSPVGVLLTDR